MAFGVHVQKADTLIRDWIKTSGIREGNRLPSERALARQMDLPHYSINRAMAHLISEGLIIREGYKLYCGSKRAAESSFTCHLMINYGSTNLKSFRKVARELGVSLVLDRWESVDDAVALLHQLDTETTTGVIFEPPFVQGIHSWEQTTQRLLSHGIPVVCTSIPGTGVPNVLADHPRALKLIFDHLKELGHHELALVSVHSLTPTVEEVLDTWKLLCAQYGFTNSIRRIQIPNVTNMMKEDIADLTNRLVGEWEKVTALVIYSESLFNAHLLLESLTRKKKNVPKDLSLIFVRDFNNLRTLTPPVSAVDCDGPLIQEMAFRMIQRMARKKDSPGFTDFSQFMGSIRIQPELILRGSTAMCLTASHRHEHLPLQAAASSPKSSSEKSHMEVEQDRTAALKRPYDLTARAAATRFAQLDLKTHMNRPLNFRRGWLGDLPLRNFDPGEHIIHGVPFHILGGHTRADCGAIIFHSNMNSRGNAQELPTHLRVPIAMKAKAVYILHGCGFARFLNPFASYAFYRGRKQIEKVPIVSLGQSPASYNENDGPSDSLRANIQDWWPDVPQRNFPHARMAPINESESPDGFGRYVYLYTLEWINPSPEKPVDALEIEVDPVQSTTLGVLAITVLRP
jgi:DNA-binding LacI/PurR family transcriptional regulator